MKLNKLFFLAFILSSCASTSHKSSSDELKKEIKEDKVSIGAVLDLARSSYLKGCVDGMKHIIKKETYGSTFEFCKVKAKSHEADIFEILK